MAGVTVVTMIVGLSGVKNFPRGSKVLVEDGRRTVERSPG